MMIIDEALLFFSKMAGDFSRYMVECGIFIKKEKIKMVKRDGFGNLINVEDAEIENNQIEENEIEFSDDFNE